MTRSTRSASTSGSTSNHRSHQWVVIDFWSNWLDKIDPEHVELILGQMLYGIIKGRLFHEYGRLVQYFVTDDDSVATTVEGKLRYLDDIFEACHRNLVYLEGVLAQFRDYDIYVRDVSYDRSARNVSFLITHEDPGLLRRDSPLSDIPRQRRYDGRPFVQDRRDLQDVPRVAEREGSGRAQLRRGRPHQSSF